MDSSTLLILPLRHWENTDAMSGVACTPALLLSALSYRDKMKSIMRNEREIVNMGEMVHRGRNTEHNWTVVRTSLSTISLYFSSCWLSGRSFSLDTKIFLTCSLWFMPSTWTMSSSRNSWREENGREEKGGKELGLFYVCYLSLIDQTAFRESVVSASDTNWYTENGMFKLF